MFLPILTPQVYKHRLTKLCTVWFKTSQTWMWNLLHVTLWRLEFRGGTLICGKFVENCCSYFLTDLGKIPRRRCPHNSVDIFRASRCRQRHFTFSDVKEILPHFLRFHSVWKKKLRSRDAPLKLLSFVKIDAVKATFYYWRISICPSIASHLFFPVVWQSGVRDLPITMFSISEFRENRRAFLNGRKWN